MIPSDIEQINSVLISEFVGPAKEAGQKNHHSHDKQNIRGCQSYFHL
jgi:hypothetical protein